ncbi:hypothetical protein [Acidianus sp. HS-5]|uniref:hypothetical protein n=1 Tax=Acidianus sp. HS-5 TaxID=2886040 RepID=UPI001F2A952B|nr:hypothetical protein [Acidianus sp. HS-5]BDC17919.1 hypothetical protein HS5_08090 [Acidianus sp. HS-5]
MIGRILIPSIFLVLIGAGVIYFTLSSFYSTYCYSKIIQFEYFAYKYVKYNVTEYLYDHSTYLYLVINASKPIYVEGIFNCGKEIVKMCRIMNGCTKCFKKIPCTTNVTYLKILIGEYSIFKYAKPKVENAMIKIHDGIEKCNYVLRYHAKNCGNVPIYVVGIFVHIVCKECINNGNKTIVIYCYRNYHVSVNKWLDPECTYRYSTQIYTKLVCACITISYNTLCMSMHSTTHSYF